MDAADGADDHVWLKARGANAARQLRQFRRAERLARQAERSLATLPEKGGWGTYLTKLRIVIARRDAGIEPLDMIPALQVAFACLRQPPLTAFDRAGCGAPQVVARMAEIGRSTR